MQHASRTKFRLLALQLITSASIFSLPSLPSNLHPLFIFSSTLSQLHTDFPTAVVKLRQKPDPLATAGTDETPGTRRKKPSRPVSMPPGRLPPPKLTPPSQKQEKPARPPSLIVEKVKPILFAKKCCSVASVHTYILH